MLVYDGVVVFFFKQKTAYEMRISDWSSDVCSSDLVAGRIGGRGIVGADEARSGAILFKPLFARRACLAAIDHAADTDRFSHREIGHLVAHRADMADDLMAGNARVMRAAPFAADLMKVRMADAAIGDLDDDVVRAGLAAGDRQRLERTIGGGGDRKRTRSNSRHQ